MVAGERLEIKDSSCLPKGDLNELLGTLRTLVKNDSTLDCVDSDEFLLRFIKASDCNPEKAYQLVVSYFQAKKENPEEFLFKSPAEYVDVISRLDLGFVLRKGDCDGRPIVFLRFGNIDPSHDSWPMLMQSGTLILESLSLEPEVQESGVCLVLDCTNFSLKIMKWATPFKLKALMRFFQESVPVRFDNVHIVNAPLTFRVFYAAITPFVGEEFVHKLVWHKKPFKMLVGTLGHSNTPSHLGGDLNVDYTRGWYQDLVLAKEPIFRRKLCEMPWLNACLCSPEDRPRPSVSAPLHLILKSEQESQCHAFRTKTFKKPRPCNYCHQPIYNEGSSCRVCKYLCHKTCEEKHAVELASRNVTPYKQSWATETQPTPRRDEGSGMDLTYITERILALWFPADTGPQEYRHGHQEAAHMLHSKHGNNYMVFNLSEPRGGTRREHVRVREVGWPPDLAPPLERLCSVCKDIDSWLSEDSSRIAVLHARGNRERIGVIVAAYMHYSSICGSPEQALDRFAMKRYLDHKVGDLELPSNRRYVDYFSGLLSGCIRINSAPLYLTHVTVLGAPSFEPGTCGCRAFLKVYEGLVPVYTSGIHTVSQDTRQFTVTIATGGDRRGLQLRGDILIKCYHRHYCNDENSTRCSSPGDSSVASGEPLLQRELIFACQFHTCAVTDHTLSFTRQELDIACNDLRFPLDGAVELHFAGRSDTPRVAPAPTPAVPVDNSLDPVTRWDSYEHLDHPPPLSPDSDITEDPNDAEVNHTYGPLDGSLYATVSKKEEVIASPHTVSMDSGISSAGNGLNATQGPSLDQHRELDKLLSEMLMTVRDIEDVPYHARTDSRPFSYGLASPRLVRKLGNGTGNESDRPSPVFHEGSVITGSLSQDTTNNLTWLQRQQQKLQDRREVQKRWDREPTGTMLLSELRMSQTVNRSPSRRTDGYASDTSHLRDEEDFTVPLHINTSSSKGSIGSAPVSPLLPHRSSSRRHPLTSAAARARSADPAPFTAKTRKYSDSSPGGLSEPDSGLLSALESGSATNTRSPSDSSEETTAWPPPPSELQLRDEGYSWRTTSTTSEGTGSPANSPRPQTPAFPVHPRTPYSNGTHSHFDLSGLPPKSPTASRKEWSTLGETLHRELSSTSSRGYDSSDNQHSPKSPVMSNGTLNGGQSSPSPTVYYGTSRRSSIHSNGEPPQEVSPAHVKFVRDTSKYWYKPSISREEAINLLRDRSPGTFVVRDSNSFPGAFGLALKVATPPPNAGKSPTGDPANELVRHFLIEPTSRGVRLKGCTNEPVFSSLSALVYQHTLTPLALPCKLMLPETDTTRQAENSSVSSAQLLLAQGAACNVLYLMTVETESLTGPQAVVRAVTHLFSGPLPTAVVVHFKVSSQGITLTDNKRQLFFRRHYPVATISYCGLDPDDHRWSQRNESTGMPMSSLRCFGFVARKPGSKSDNQCHIFAELEPEQPANAIVNFVTKVMMNGQAKSSNIV